MNFENDNETQLFTAFVVAHAACLAIRKSLREASAFGIVIDGALPTVSINIPYSVSGNETRFVNAEITLTVCKQ